MAQGVVNFTASALSRPVQYTTDGTTLVKVPVGSPASVGTFGTLNVTMYDASAGTVLTTTTVGSVSVPNFSGWLIDSPLIQSIPSQAGGIPSTGITLNTTQPTEQVEVVGWTGTYTTFAQALTAAEAGQALIGWSGSTLSGGALSWLASVGTSLSPASSPVGTAAYNGLVLQPVPEPATIALGGLGAAALLLFRRRK